MPRAQAAILPRDLRRQSSYDHRLGTVINVSSAEEYEQVVVRLSQLGFSAISTAGPNEPKVIFVKQKKLGGKELAVFLYGLVFFVIPGIIYFLNWSRKPAPTVTVRRTYVL